MLVHDAHVLAAFDAALLDHRAERFTRLLARAAIVRQVEAFGDRMNILQPSLARAALTAKASLERRRAVKLVALLLFAGTAALGVEQVLPWRTWRADHVTRAGEIRTVTL